MTYVRAKGGKKIHLIKDTWCGADFTTLCGLLHWRRTAKTEPLCRRCLAIKAKDVAK